MRKVWLVRFLIKIALGVDERFEDFVVRNNKGGTVYIDRTEERKYSRERGCGRVRYTQLGNRH